MSTSTPNENSLNVKSPLQKNDHPELDITMLCYEKQITKYMCMIGQLQWAITLGRYDVLAHVMSMSRFRLACKIGHLERMKRLYGYVTKTKHFTNRYRTKEPDYSHVPKQGHDWSRTVYWNVREEIPKDITKPFGKRATTTTFLDANLLHDIITGKSVTAVLLCQHHLNRLVLKETSHSGDSNIWFRICCCQNSNRTNDGLRNTLRYLGVPIMTNASMFGDNKSAVTSLTIPQSILNKRHTMLSYQRVREGIAAKI